MGVKITLRKMADQGIAVICGSDRCGDRLISFWFCTKIFWVSEEEGFKSFERVVKLFLGDLGMKLHCISELAKFLIFRLVSLSWQVSRTLVLS